MVIIVRTANPWFEEQSGNPFVGSTKLTKQDPHSEHRFPAPSSKEKGCRQDVLGVVLEGLSVSRMCLEFN